MAVARGGTLFRRRFRYTIISALTQASLSAHQTIPRRFTYRRLFESQACLRPGCVQGLGQTRKRNSFQMRGGTRLRSSRLRRYYIRLNCESQGLRELILPVRLSETIERGLFCRAWMIRLSISKENLEDSMLVWRQLILKIISSPCRLPEASIVPCAVSKIHCAPIQQGIRLGASVQRPSTRLLWSRKKTSMGNFIPIVWIAIKGNQLRPGISSPCPISRCACFRSPTRCASAVSAKFDARSDHGFSCAVEDGLGRHVGIEKGGCNCTNSGCLY